MHVETWCRLQNWPPYLLMANPLYHKLFQEMNICQCEFCYSCMILCWSTRGSWNCPQQNREPVSLTVHVQYYGYWNCWWPSSEKSQERALHICPFFFLSRLTKISQKQVISNPEENCAQIHLPVWWFYVSKHIVLTSLFARFHFQHSDELSHCDQGPLLLAWISNNMPMISLPAFWWIISSWPGATFTSMDK